MPISLGLDAVGGPATATMASVLSPGAHLVSYAWLSGLPIHVLQGDLIGKRLNIHGFWMYYEEYLPKMRAALTEATKVVAGVRTGRGNKAAGLHMSWSCLRISFPPPPYRVAGSLKRGSPISSASGNKKPLIRAFALAAISEFPYAEWDTGGVSERVIFPS
jgi:hypothetical protein